MSLLCVAAAAAARCCVCWLLCVCMCRGVSLLTSLVMCVCACVTRNNVANQRGMLLPDEYFRSQGPKHDKEMTETVNEWRRLEGMRDGR